jgi:hypothetical protein
MTDWIKRALTRRLVRKGTRGHQIVAEEVNIKLVYTVKFALGMSLSLSAVEVAHMAFLHTWNSEIFAAITGLIGTVTGILIGRNS